MYHGASSATLTCDGAVAERSAPSTTGAYVASARSPTTSWTASTKKPGIPGDSSKSFEGRAYLEGRSGSATRWCGTSSSKGIGDADATQEAVLTTRLPRANARSLLSRAQA